MKSLPEIIGQVTGAALLCVREEAQKEQTKPIRAAKKVSNLALLPFGAAGKY